MSFKLPSYQLPQLHTMRLRIGCPLKPSEMFHLLVSKDMHEISTEMAPTVCTIDFINAVICNELFAIVTDWHQALPKLKAENKIQRLFRKNHDKILKPITIAFLFGGLFALLAVTHFMLSNASVQFDSKQFVERGYQWLAASFMVGYVMYIVGRGFALWTIGNIHKMDDLPVFDLTKGDKNRTEEIKQKNSKMIREVIVKLIVSGIILLIGLFFKKILYPFVDLFFNFPKN